MNTWSVVVLPQGVSIWWRPDPPKGSPSDTFFVVLQLKEITLVELSDAGRTSDTSARVYWRSCCVPLARRTTSGQQPTNLCTGFQQLLAKTHKSLAVRATRVSGQCRRAGARIFLSDFGAAGLGIGQDIFGGQRGLVGSFADSWVVASPSDCMRTNHGLSLPLCRQTH